MDYLYLASAKNDPGVINVYRVDAQTGALLQIPNSPFPAGRNPVGLVTSPNGKTLYVINHDDNTIIVYGIGTDAKLYAQSTYNTPGSEPVALAINAAGTLLFVVDFYAPLFTDLNPGPGALIVYSIDPATGNLGQTGPVTQTLPSAQSASYYPLNAAPTAVNVLANGSTLYVTDQAAGCAKAPATLGGAVEALSIGSTGVVTPVAGSPLCAGVTPSAVASHPSSSYVYVTDSAQSQLLGFSVGVGGALSPVGSVGTGEAPSSVVVDSNGRFMFVTNRGSSNLTGYSIAAGTGIPSLTGSYGTGAFPQCVIVEPHLKRFVYTADFQGLGITGYELDPSTGVLSGTENSPYGGTGLSTCLTATTHGSQR
ncbi:MAG TPA: beta-propeller fold lactonase family protein [Acidobacteriaceae bacterium]